MMNRRRAWELVFSGFFLLAMFLVFASGYLIQLAATFEDSGQ